MYKHVGVAVFYNCVNAAVHENSIFKKCCYFIFAGSYLTLHGNFK